MLACMLVFLLRNRDWIRKQFSVTRVAESNPKCGCGEIFLDINAIARPARENFALPSTAQRQTKPSMLGIPLWLKPQKIGLGQTSRLRNVVLKRQARPQKIPSNGPPRFAPAFLQARFQSPSAPRPLPAKQYPIPAFPARSPIPAPASRKPRSGSVFDEEPGQQTRPRDELDEEG
jgi:hypothetical protein